MQQVVRELPPAPPWSAQILTLASTLGWVEDLIELYGEKYGEPKARELLEAGLLEAENRRGRQPLRTVRYLAELRPQ